MVQVAILVKYDSLRLVGLLPARWPSPGARLERQQRRISHAAQLLLLHYTPIAGRREWSTWRTAAKSLLAPLPQLGSSISQRSMVARLHPFTLCTCKLNPDHQNNALLSRTVSTIIQFNSIQYFQFNSMVVHIHRYNNDKRLNREVSQRLYLHYYLVYALPTFVGWHCY